MRHAKQIGLALFLVASMAVCTAQNIEKRAQEIADVLGLQPGMSVADVGAGDGDWSFALAQIVGEDGQVFATEVDADKLKKIERSLKRRNLKQVQTVLGDQESTGLGPGSVDAVLIRLVYHHFVQPEKMQQDLKRALRPGGRIAIVDFGPENNYPRSSVPGFRNGHGVIADTVIEEMQAAGFQLEERRDRWDGNRDRYLLVFSLP